MSEERLEIFTEYQVGILTQIIQLSIIQYHLAAILLKAHDFEAKSSAEQVLEECPHLQKLIENSKACIKAAADIPRRELDAIVPYLIKPEHKMLGQVALKGLGQPFLDTQDLIDLVQNWPYFTPEEIEATKAAELQMKKAIWAGPRPEAIASPIPLGTKLIVKLYRQIWIPMTTITACPDYEFNEIYGDCAAEHPFTRTTISIRVDEYESKWIFVPGGWKWDWIQQDPRPKPVFESASLAYCSCGYPFSTNLIWGKPLKEEAFWMDIGEGSPTVLKKLNYCPACHKKLLKGKEDFEDDE